jgi:hypothetical protein
MEMQKMARMGICPTCGKTVSVRKDGLTWSHGGNFGCAGGLANVSAVERHKRALASARAVIVDAAVKEREAESLYETYERDTPYEELCARERVYWELQKARRAAVDRYVEMCGAQPS